MNKNTGDGELDEFLKTLNIHNKDLDICFCDAIAVGRLKFLIIQEENKAVKRYQELQHEELVNELVKTKREAQQQLLLELKKQATQHCAFKIDQYGSDLDTEDVRLAVPVRKIDERIAELSVIQNKLEGLS